MSKDIEDPVRRWREDAVEDNGPRARRFEEGETSSRDVLHASGLGKGVKSARDESYGTNSPKIHNLIKLATRTDISFNEEQMKLLSAMNFYQLAGRYLNSRDGRIDPDRAVQNFRKSEKLFGWLISQ